MSLGSEDVKTKLGVSEQENDMSSLKKSYADVESSDASAPPSGDGMELNVIIRNLNCDPSEQTDKTVTMNKVDKLLRDGLKLKFVKVTSCERKQTKGPKPGVIVERIETVEQKQEMMRVKNCLDYKHVYIENDKRFSTRVNESNMFTVLKELGKASILSPAMVESWRRQRNQEVDTKGVLRSVYGI